jgi:hypothetical protein
MMHGPPVKRLQELCDLLGFDMGDNDGIFGPQTRLAVLGVQHSLNLEPDGIAGPRTWRGLLNYLDRNPMGSEEVEGIVDRRGKHPNARLFGWKRSWKAVEGVTLHQTGCEMPRAPRGWDRLNAHIGITQEGKAILVNDPKDMIWHAQGLSQSTIGIEIEGNYCGVSGDTDTLWKGGGGPHQLNGKMIRALDYVFDWLVDQFDKAGSEWAFVNAHRQSSGSRRGDPGSEIWNRVGLDWARRLNLKEADRGDQWRYKTGRPIPKQWDDKRSGEY